MNEFHLILGYRPLKYEPRPDRGIKFNRLSKQLPGLTLQDIKQLSKSDIVEKEFVTVNDPIVIENKLQITLQINKPSKECPLVYQIDGKRKASTSEVLGDSQNRCYEYTFSIRTPNSTNIVAQLTSQTPLDLTSSTFAPTTDQKFSFNDTLSIRQSHQTLSASSDGNSFLFYRPAGEDRINTSNIYRNREEALLGELVSSDLWYEDCELGSDIREEDLYFTKWVEEAIRQAERKVEEQKTMIKEVYEDYNWSDVAAKIGFLTKYFLPGLYPNVALVEINEVQKMIEINNYPDLAKALSKIKKTLESAPTANVSSLRQLIAKLQDTYKEKHELEQRKLLFLLRTNHSIGAIYERIGKKISNLLGIPNFYIVSLSTGQLLWYGSDPVDRVVSRFGVKFAWNNGRSPIHCRHSSGVSVDIETPEVNFKSLLTSESTTILYFDIEKGSMSNLDRSICFIDIIQSLRDPATPPKLQQLPIKYDFKSTTVVAVGLKTVYIADCAKKDHTISAFSFEGKLLDKMTITNSLFDDKSQELQPQQLEEINYDDYYYQQIAIAPRIVDIAEIVVFGNYFVVFYQIEKTFNTYITMCRLFFQSRVNSELSEVNEFKFGNRIYQQNLSWTRGRGAIPVFFACDERQYWILAIFRGKLIKGAEGTFETSVSWITNVGRGKFLVATNTSGKLQLSKLSLAF